MRVCGVSRSGVRATSVQLKRRVSVLEQQTFTRTERSSGGKGGVGNSADPRFYSLMAHRAGEHTEPSCWKLEEEPTLIRGGLLVPKLVRFKRL